MFADRAQAIAEVIVPALHAGHIVLCDRFTDSSEAYQGAGRQLGVVPILELHHLLCGDIQPDLTLLLLPSLTVALRRARRRNQHGATDASSDEGRFECEPDSFYQRVHAGYLELARRNPQRVVTIDADASIDAIKTRILEIVTTRLSQSVESS